MNSSKTTRGSVPRHSPKKRYFKEEDKGMAGKRILDGLPTTCSYSNVAVAGTTVILRLCVLDSIPPLWVPLPTSVQKHIEPVPNLPNCASNMS